MTTGSDKLTPKEMEHLRYLADGLTRPEIAKMLTISQDTVKWHRWWLYVKLDAKNGPHAVAIAFRRGILPVSA